MDCCVGTWWKKWGPVYEFLFCFLFAYFVCINLMRWSWFILEMGCVLSCLLACLVIWRIHDPFISRTTISLYSKMDSSMRVAMEKSMDALLKLMLSWHASLKPNHVWVSAINLILSPIIKEWLSASKTNIRIYLFWKYP